ncbi:MAG: hypothetical protein GF350_16580 [Chitinivibrionales bacterium]|nr:hypothetical protein [Chitinivibrionales bacterium]
MTPGRLYGKEQAENENKLLRFYSPGRNHRNDANADDGRRWYESMLGLSERITPLKEQQIPVDFLLRSWYIIIMQINIMF